MQRTMPGARRRGRPRTAWIDNIKTWTGLPVEESVRMTDDRDKWRKYSVRPWCGQRSDRGRLKNRTEQLPQAQPQPTSGMDLCSWGGYRFLSVCSVIEKN